MGNDNPNQPAPVAERPPDTTTTKTERVETTRETETRRAETERVGASGKGMDEVNDYRLANGNAQPGDANAPLSREQTLTGNLEGRDPATLNATERAQLGLGPQDGARRENGVLVDESGQPIDGAERQIAALNGDLNARMDLGLPVNGLDSVNNGTQALDMDNDGQPDVWQQPTPARELAATEHGEGEHRDHDHREGEGQPTPRTGADGQTVVTNTHDHAAGDQTTKIAKTEDEVYTTAPGGTEQTVAQNPVRARSVTAPEETDRSVPGGPATNNTLAAAGRPGPTATTPVADGPPNPGGDTRTAPRTDGADTRTEPRSDATPQTPEQQRIAEARRALDNHFQNSPHRDQVASDLNTFLARTDITDAQKAQALENLNATANQQFIPGNNSRSDMSQADVDSAVAGGINDIAKPKNIDQGNNGTCNATVIQEGVAGGDPARYTASLREAALHGTYTGSDGFKALIPSDMLRPHQEAQGAQNVDGTRNFSSQLLQGGMLNHYWQQHGQYYTDTDRGGEQRYAFDASKATPEALRAGQNPFTTDFKGSGAGVGANEVAFMGRNMGIQGQFVFARPEWLTPGEPIDPGVRVVNSAQELTQAKQDRERQTGSSWSVAVVNANNRLFTGSEGQGGSGGGHVVSSYTNGDLSNQWGGGFDRKGVSDQALFDSMSQDSRTWSGGDRGRPSGNYDDNTLPERFRQHKEDNPNAHQDGIRQPGETDQDKRPKEDEKDKKKAEADDPDGQRRRQADATRGSLQGQRAAADARRAQAQAELDARLSSHINDGLTDRAMSQLYAADATLRGIDTQILRTA